MATDDQLTSLLKKSIDASNRTTHAVRALVRFLFIQLSFLTAAFLVWQIGLAFPDRNTCSVLGCEPYDIVLLVVVLLVVFGVVVSSIVGWDELRSSNVPKETQDRAGARKADGEAKVQAKTQRKSFWQWLNED